MKVPDVLLSGNHEEIKIWRKEQMLKRTKERKKDRQVIVGSKGGDQ